MKLISNSFGFKTIFTRRKIMQNMDFNRYLFKFLAIVISKYKRVVNIQFLILISIIIIQN